MCNWPHILQSTHYESATILQRLFSLHAETPVNRKQEAESAITLGWWLLRCCSVFSIQNRILLQNSNHHQHWTVFVLIPCFMRAWIFRPGSSFYADHTPSLIYRPPVTAAVAIWIRIPLNILYSHILTQNNLLFLRAKSQPCHIFRLLC